MSTEEANASPAVALKNSHFSEQAQDFLRRYGWLLGVITSVATIIGVVMPMVTHHNERAEAQRRAAIEATIDRAVERQRADFQEQVAVAREHHASTAAHLESLRDRVNRLEARIDRSIDLPRAFREMQRGGSVPNAGGSDAELDALQDYAVRLAMRDLKLTVEDAEAFVGKAFAHPTGSEANRLIELAQAANARGTGVVR
jgi:hypothetical protein